MIRGVHAMFFSSRPHELRAFLRDKLGFTSFTDVSDGWLIFDIPEADMGVHPASAGKDGMSGTHQISSYCDDIHKTVDELKACGVKFVGKIVDRGYALVTHFKMPGTVIVELYQPSYTKSGRSRRKRS